MNKLIFIFLSCLPIPLMSSAIDLTEVTKLIQAEKYADAVDQLHKIEVDQNIISKEIFSNLGYCYFKLNHVANALLNYERALRIDPTDKELKVAIKSINDQLENRIFEVPEFIVIRMYRSFLNQFDSTTWAFVQFVFAGLLIIVLATVLFWGRFNKSLYVLFTLVLLVILSTVITHQKNYLETNSDFAIVMKDQLGLMRAADERSGEVTILSAGTKVNIVDQIEGWCKVVLADKDSGWLKKTELEII